MLQVLAAIMLQVSALGLASCPYEKLRAPYERDKLLRFFASRPLAVAGRALDFSNAYRRCRNMWESTDGDTARGELLRQEVAALGPVAVKFGQTLSQRPDVLPEDVCEALKSLQMSNKKFDNAQAMQMLEEELPGSDSFFAHIDPEPIAAASLGQVYRATTHDGVECAVKVQRPEAMKQVALDVATCVVLGETIVSLGLFPADRELDRIIDTAAAGVFSELDYRLEAENAEAFRQSMRFLGYVKVPRTVWAESPRVLVSEWVHGKHLQALPPADQLRLTYMACEAVTASIMVTGMVHADPHEGNLLLTDTGSLAFLDFGLMSRVEPDIMEAFALGIQAVVSKDYIALVRAFVATQFVQRPVERRADVSSEWEPASEEAMAQELEQLMESVPGGTSRFGALASVLIDMGNTWRFYSPPYVILLIRTFVTLEGIAGQVDANFNIYEVALPWAIQRALSPSTDIGAALT